MFSYVAVLLLLLFVHVVFGDNAKCDQISILSTMADHNTVVETTPKLLAGTWNSEGCETRPGPEYVLRSYTFDEDGTYYLVQHHYYDDSCSSPQFSVFSHGRIQLRNSLIQPGAATGISKTTNITVIPQDHNSAKEMDRMVAKECPGQFWKNWKRYEEHSVYDNKYNEKKTYNLWKASYAQLNNQRSFNKRENMHHASGDISCLGSLKWAFNELKLLKIQLRPLNDKSRIKKNPRQMKMELLLGDIHSNYKLREYYSPTSFQVPLIKQSKGETYSFNRHSYVIKNPNNIPNWFTNSKTPPHLIEKPHLPPYIWGEWTSSRCETRPMALYLTRKFSFIAEDSTWIGEHKFYSDPFCASPKFTVTAAGHFELSSTSKILKGTTNIDFHIENATLSVSEHRLIYDFRLPGNCGLGDWELNVPKELSSTNGCTQLGIALPSVQYDIIKMEMDYQGSCLLFMGQVDTDNMPTTERPSAFQLPMVKCGDVTSYSQSLQDFYQNTYYNSSNNFHLNLYILMISIISFILR